MARNYQQGKYEIQNWDKYIGTKNPRYLSSYELEVFKWMDKSKAVLKWGAEVVVVPYYNPVKDRAARYIVDIYVEYKNRNGEVKKELLEIKPSSQVVLSKRGGKSKKTYLEEQLTYNTNMAKWHAAKKYAEERGWQFRILTEKSIFRG